MKIIGIFVFQRDMRDTLFAQGYIDRVKSELADDLPRLEKFLEIMHQFSLDTGSAVEVLNICWLCFHFFLTYYGACWIKLHRLLINGGKALLSCNASMLHSNYRNSDKCLSLSYFVKKVTLN